MVHKSRLNYAVVLVECIDDAVAFFTNIIGWKSYPLKTALGGSQGTDTSEEVFVDANGLWLKLVPPTSGNISAETLKDKVVGSIIAINFESGDRQSLLDDMDAKGFTLLTGQDGSLDQRGVEGTVYWPRDLAEGTTVSSCESAPDALWGCPQVEPALDVPSMSHIAIVVADLERSARFYTDVMGLRRSKTTMNIDGELNQAIGSLKTAFIDANGVF